MRRLDCNASRAGRAGDAPPQDGRSDDEDSSTPALLVRPPPLFLFPFPLSLAPRLRALARVRACVRVLGGCVGEWVGGRRRRRHRGVVVVVVGFMHARVLARVRVRVRFARPLVAFGGGHPSRLGACKIIEGALHVPFSP